MLFYCYFLVFELLTLGNGVFEMKAYVLNETLVVVFSKQMLVNFGVRGCCLFCCACFERYAMGNVSLMQYLY